jgi:hypothetical protein
MLHQSAYITKLEKIYQPSHTGSVQFRTPAASELPSLIDLALDSEGADPEFVRSYQSLVGALLYVATCTRPDVAYSVSMLCRAMIKPARALPGS